MSSFYNAPRSSYNKVGNIKLGQNKKAPANKPKAIFIIMRQYENPKVKTKLVLTSSLCYEIAEGTLYLTASEVSSKLLNGERIVANIGNHRYSFKKEEK